MNRKTERRLSLSSEAGKALLVKNKCEQLKLEKKRRSLDRLQAYETVDFMNKKRELIDPRTSIHSWKTGDRHDSISHRITSAKPESDKNVDTYPKYRFRSRSQSLSGPNFVSSLVRSEDSLNSRRLFPHIRLTAIHEEAVLRLVSGLTAFVNVALERGQQKSTEGNLLQILN